MAESMFRGRLLVVDDEPGIRSFLAWRLRARGLEVQLACDGEEALDQLERQPFDLVITDVTMPRLEGLALLETVKRRYPTTEVILMTGFSTVDMAVGAMRLGAFNFLLKPFRLNALLKTVDQALAQGRLRGQARGTE